MKVIKRKSFSHVDVVVEDLQEAEKLLIKWIQEEAFEEQLKILKDSNIDEDTRESKKERKKFLRKNDLLVQLDPFVDQSGVLRVGGRLKKSDLEENIKHPIILPKKGKISRLVVESCHRRVRHQGRGITTNEIRNSGYWILQCNTLVRKVISDCVACRFLRGRRGEQKMADLPSDRIQEAPPFTYCAVDYFGPFYIKEKRKELKRYGCLFTCLTSRAVHIEISNTLETDSFIMALRRFINIRGNIRQLRSDWGSNFVGAERELREAVQEMDHDKIQRALLNEGADYLVIKWKRNPPSASHMGGVWERQIRSVRAILSALFRVHGASLNDEALRTFMAETTGILNSRPLTVENLNSPDCLPLSPNNLLTMKTKVVLPPPGNFPRADIYSRKYWRRVQHLADEFWRRWRKEYLQNQLKRTKWHNRRDNFRVGDIVLIVQDNVSRNEWNRGKIVNVREDSEGQIRSVFVKIGNRGDRSEQVLERPIDKLVFLCSTEDDEETI